MRWLDPNGHSQDMTEPAGYRHVARIAQILHSLVDTGAEVVQPVKYVGRGMLRSADRMLD